MHSLTWLGLSKVLVPTYMWAMVMPLSVSFGAQTVVEGGVSWSMTSASPGPEGYALCRPWTVSSSQCGRTRCSRSMAIGSGSMPADPWSRWRWGGSVKDFLRGIKSRSAPHRTCSVTWRLGSGRDMCWPTARVRRFQRRNATCLLEGRGPSPLLRLG